MKPTTLVTFDDLRAIAADQWRTSVAKDHCRRRLGTDGNDDAFAAVVPPRPRDQVFRLGALVGDLCRDVLQYAPLDPVCAEEEAGRDEAITVQPNDDGSEENFAISTAPSLFRSESDDHQDKHRHPFWCEESDGRTAIETSMASLFLGLFVASDVCGIDLRSSIFKKIELNGRKYPVELCRGKSGKYTKYSHHTGITKTIGQSTLDSPASKSVHGIDIDDDDENAPSHTIKGATSSIRQFALDRKWSKYHTPRNIALALLGELGELAELFQWRGDGDGDGEGGLAGWSDEDIDKTGQEFADVSIYLLRMADVCGVDLGEAAMRRAWAKEGAE